MYEWAIIEYVIVSAWALVIGLFIGLLIGKYLNILKIRKEESIEKENELLKITIKRLEFELSQLRKVEIK